MKLAAGTPESSYLILAKHAAAGHRRGRKILRAHPTYLTMSSANFNEIAAGLIADGRLTDARTVLEKAVQIMPADWKPIREDGLFTEISFWDQEEFLAYNRGPSRSADACISWMLGSYSFAWYLLAVVASKQQHFEHALFCVKCGIDLEPDHPELWSEQGFILGRMKRYEEALESYLRAARVRLWATRRQMARALRGQGIVLIDLERLDDAESALKQSLEFEPHSEVAANELAFIEQLRRERAERQRVGPWFIRPLKEPPSDPLTRQLVALVEDLPSIPGPVAVGAENYSRIAEAFLERGWPGFEEEFDAIVPRDRPDYAQIKRNLLCEPIFNARAQRNLARAFAAAVGDSEETVQEVLDDIFSDRDEG